MRSLRSGARLVEKYAKARLTSGNDKVTARFGASSVELSRYFSVIGVDQNSPRHLIAEVVLQSEVSSWPAGLCKLKMRSSARLELLIPPSCES